MSHSDFGTYTAPQLRRVPRHNSAASRQRTCVRPGGAVTVGICVAVPTYAIHCIHCSNREVHSYAREFLEIVPIKRCPRADYKAKWSTRKPCNPYVIADFLNIATHLSDGCRLNSIVCLDVNSSVSYSWHKHKQAKFQRHVRYFAESTQITGRRFPTKRNWQRLTKSVPCMSKEKFTRCWCSVAGATHLALRCRLYDT